MDLLLILTYAALAYAIFRIFKIPVNSYTLLTAALGGMFLLGALLLGMNYDHPFSSQGRFYFDHSDCPHSKRASDRGSGCQQYARQGG